MRSGLGFSVSPRTVSSANAQVSYERCARGADASKASLRAISRGAGPRGYICPHAEDCIEDFVRTPGSASARCWCGPGRRTHRSAGPRRCDARNGSTGQHQLEHLRGSCRDLHEPLQRHGYARRDELLDAAGGPRPGPLLGLHRHGDDSRHGWRLDQGALHVAGPARLVPGDDPPRPDQERRRHRVARDPRARQLLHHPVQRLHLRRCRHVHQPGSGRHVRVPAVRLEQRRQQPAHRQSDPQHQALPRRQHRRGQPRLAGRQGRVRRRRARGLPADQGGRRGPLVQVRGRPRAGREGHADRPVRHEQPAGRLRRGAVRRHRHRLRPARQRRRPLPARRLVVVQRRRRHPGAAVPRRDVRDPDQGGPTGRQDVRTEDLRTQDLRTQDLRTAGSTHRGSTHRGSTHRGSTPRARTSPTTSPTAP